METDDKIRDEKLQYDINREGAKISALSSGKIDKYEYLTGEEILTPGQSRIIEHAKFTYSSLGKALEKQTKTIEDQGKKQIDALKVLKPDTQELKIKDGIPKDSLINCKINIFQTWTANCFIMAGAINNQEPTFTMTDMKLDIPIDNAKLLQQLKSGFKRTIK